jgi:hypothetical protein
LGTGARRVGFSNALAAGASAKIVKRRIVFALVGLLHESQSDALRLFQALAVRFGEGALVVDGWQCVVARRASAIAL